MYYCPSMIHCHYIVFSTQSLDVEQWPLSSKKLDLVIMKGWICQLHLSSEPLNGSTKCCSMHMPRSALVKINSCGWTLIGLGGRSNLCTLARSATVVRLAHGCTCGGVSDAFTAGTTRPCLVPLPASPLALTSLRLPLLLPPLLLCKAVKAIF